MTEPTPIDRAITQACEMTYDSPRNYPNSHHNYWKCNDGSDLSRCPTPDRPGNCGYPIARND